MPGTRHERLERMKAALKADLDALPDLPKPEPKPEPAKEPAPSGDENVAPAELSSLMGGVKLGGEKVTGTGTSSSNLEQTHAISTPTFREPKDNDYDSDEPEVGEEVLEPEWIKSISTPLGPLKEDDKPTNLTRGDLAPIGEQYTPLLNLAKYPYKYVDRPGSQKAQEVASRFFDGGKFWKRRWDLYYAWPIDATKPVIFATEAQLKDLIHEINTAFPVLELKIPEWFYHEGVLNKFNTTHPRLRPRYLGRSNSKEEYEELVRNMPKPSFTPAGEKPGQPEEYARSLEAFKKTIQEAQEIGKKKNKNAQEKKAQDRKVFQQVIGKQLKRTERYLGLRPKREAPAGAGIAASFAPFPVPVIAVPKLAPIDIMEAPPYPMELNVVFVCVDVEKFEFTEDITEIGISTLDTNDIISVPPGQGGENWVPYIRARHFRVKEHLNKRNSRYVHGDPEKFEMGVSEIVSMYDMPQVLASCFRPPFSTGRALNDRRDQNGNLPDTPTYGSLPINMAEVTQHPITNARLRTIIFVGHDPQQDIRYMQRVGYNPLNSPNLTETLDTAVLYRSLTRSPNTSSLGTMCADLNITAWNMHNAGNDAFYTLQAMIGIAVKDASDRGTAEQRADRDERMAKRLGELRLQAEERFEDEQKGWTSEEGDDGGVPVAPIDPAVREREKAEAIAAQQAKNNGDVGGGPGGRGSGYGGSVSVPGFRGGYGGSGSRGRGGIGSGRAGYAGADRTRGGRGGRGY